MDKEDRPVSDGAVTCPRCYAVAYAYLDPETNDRYLADCDECDHSWVTWSVETL